VARTSFHCALKRTPSFRLWAKNMSRQESFSSYAISMKIAP
jgi:hypothetical protein